VLFKQLKFLVKVVKNNVEKVLNKVLGKINIIYNSSALLLSKAQHKPY